MRALHDFYEVVRDRDRPPGPGTGAPQADLVEAKLMADHWQHRAERAEARAGELETLLAAAERAALELRSRIICLQGKLATATATARYQSMALVLEQQRLPLDSLAGPV